MSVTPIHILGAGIAGLVLGQAFRRRGFAAILFDRNNLPGPNHNYIISLHPQAYSSLLGILDIEEPAFRRRVAIDRSDSTQNSASTSSQSISRVNRGRLEKLLREGLDIRWNHECEDVLRSDAGVSIAFQGLAMVKPPLIVDSSGVHSPLRKSLSPTTSLRVLPFVVFRGTRQFSQEHFENLFQGYHLPDQTTLEKKVGDILLQISINDWNNDAHTVSISYKYSRPARSEDTLHRPERGTTRANDISEGLFLEIANLGGGLDSPFKEVFNPAKMRNDRILHWLMRSSLMSLKELTKLAGTGVTVIGDAAHATPILGGMGANSAIQDAVELANHIVDHGDTVCADFYLKTYSRWEKEVSESEARLASMHGVS